MSAASPTTVRAVPPRFAEAVVFWFRFGWISFGGPAGQIALMHRELVTKRGWLSERGFLRALNFCSMLPGPEAHQLAVWIGWRLHGMRGAIAAGTLFVLPSALILLALSWLYMVGGGMDGVQGLFRGLAPAVLAIVFTAWKRIAGKALDDGFLRVLALAAFVALFFFDAPYLAIVAAAALAGLASSRWFARSHACPADADDLMPTARIPSHRRMALLLVVGMALWWMPVLLAGWLGGRDGVHFQMGLLFSKAALVTFGGAYAVLPYVSQIAVGHHGWLDQTQMMAGLALAESTPGPLVMVLQFVGFVGAWQHPGVWSPPASALVGAAIATWTTFLPSSLIVLLAAPFVESIQRHRAVALALRGIQAAVAGVILDLACAFGSHVLRDSDGGIDGFAIITALLAWLAMDRFRIGVVPVLAVCGATGVALALFQPG
jgi:chromate transporter